VVCCLVKMHDLSKSDGRWDGGLRERHLRRVTVRKRNNETCLPLQLIATVCCKLLSLLGASRPDRLRVATHLRTMYDDNYAAAAAAVRAGQADEDEDDFILQQDPDKPGFVSWAEALSTRHFSQADKCSVGYWDEAQNAVALTKCRGKKQLVMGYSIGRTRYLDPEEALYLVDDGQLMLLSWHPETGADLRPGMSRVAALTAAAVQSSGAESSRSPAAAATTSGGGGSTATTMAVDDASHGAAATVVAPAARSAGAPPKWKNNDDLMERLERQMDEDEDAGADGSGVGGVGDDDVGEDMAGGEDEEEDSYDEEEEAEMRGAAISESARDQRVPQAAGSSASGDVATDSSGPVASTAAAAAGKDGHLPLPSAYAFLLQHVRLPEYLVYLHLRSTGLVALRHRPQAQAADPLLPTAAAAAATGVAAEVTAGTAPATAAATASDAADDASPAPEAPLTPAPVLLHAAGQERWLAAPATPAAVVGGGAAAAPLSNSSSADACASCARMPSCSDSNNNLGGGAAGVRGSCAHCGHTSTCSSSNSSSRGGAAAARASGSASRWVTSVEPDVQPVYDAYARDGITSFKPSAPGPPDFYVCVQT